VGALTGSMRTYPASLRQGRRIATACIRYRRGAGLLPASTDFFRKISVLCKGAAGVADLQRWRTGRASAQKCAKKPVVLQGGPQESRKKYKVL